MFRKTIQCGTFISIFTIMSMSNMLAGPRSTAFEHPIVFEPNQGQFAPDVQWMARGRGYQVFTTADSVTFVLLETAARPQQKNRRSLSFVPEQAAATDAQETVLRMKLAGSRGWSASGIEPTGGVSNYFVGNDPKHWHTNIPHYRQLRIASVYSGIDLVFYDHNGDLEYDFVVSPGADPKQIRLAFEGADHIRLDET